MPSQLPQELIDMIIDFSYLDLRTLSRMALVHSCWLPATGHHLFSTVHFTETKSKSFIALLQFSPAAAERIVYSIRSVVIEDVPAARAFIETMGKAANSSESENVSDMSIDNLIRSRRFFDTACCLQVQKFRSDPSPEPISTLYHLICNRFPNVITFDFRLFRHTGLGTGSFLHALAMLPSLEYLTLSGSFDFAVEPRPVPLNIPAQPSTVLSVKGIHVRQYAFGLLWRLLPTQALFPLEMLHIGTIVANDLGLVSPFVLAVGKTLKHLRLSFYDFSTIGPELLNTDTPLAGFVTEANINLESIGIHIEQHFDLPDLSEYLPYLIQFISELSRISLPNLERISFMLDISLVDCDQWVNLDNALMSQFRGQANSNRAVEIFLYDKAQTWDSELLGQAERLHQLLPLFSRCGALRVHDESNEPESRAYILDERLGGLKMVDTYGVLHY